MSCETYQLYIKAYKRKYKQQKKLVLSRNSLVIIKNIYDSRKYTKYVQPFIKVKEDKYQPSKLIA